MIIGQKTAVGSAPSATTLTTVLTGDGYQHVVVWSVDIASSTTGANASVVWNDGTTDFPILDAKAIAAASVEKLEWFNGFHIGPDMDLKVQTSLADELTFSFQISYLSETSG